MTRSYVQVTPLRVFVLWHPRFPRGQELANALYRHLCNDPAQLASRGSRIPVRFRSLPPEGATMPPQVYLNAEQTLVVVLVDDEMVDAAAWGEYVAEIQRQCQAAAAQRKGYPPQRLIPVSLSANAFKLHPEVGEVNYLRLHTHEEAQQSQALLNGVSHELARLLLNRPQVGDEGKMREAPAPVKVFLSHAKQGGLDLTKAFRSYIASETQLDTFFDAHDIPPGTGWAKVLSDEAGDNINALLVLQTDAYSTREWCRIEALKAKLGWVPTVVVQAIEQAEVRSFPYLGNLPTIRWPLPVGDSADPWGVIVGRLLYEVLRAAYFPKWVQHVCALYGLNRPVRALPYPPELLTLLTMQRYERQHPGAIFVYPDPPLGTEELEILHEAAPNSQIVTPIRLPQLAHEMSQTQV